MDVKKVVMAVALVPIVGLVVWDRITAKIEDRNAEMRSAMLSYLAQPQFSGRDFLKQLTGVEGRFQMYDLDEEMVYLSVPEDKFKDGETLKKLTRDPKAVQFADNRVEYWHLGEYQLFDLSQRFFRMPARVFRVDGESMVETPYSITKYRVSVGELTDYLRNRVTYGGPDYFKWRDAAGVRHRMSNHGAFVSKREPSLERFVRPVAKRAGSTEKTIGALLYFVTNYIDYDTLEAMDDVQVMKHASEVLLTKRATCSGKTILFASLLEQLGVDYLLAYEPGEAHEMGHIVVLVPAGKFPNENGYETVIGGKKYQYAETTAHNFLIGTTVLKTKDPAKRIRFIQKPGGPVFDRTSVKPLEFIK